MTSPDFPPPMHGDPLFTQPAAVWSQRDWDDFLHLNFLALDEQAIAAARARETAQPTTTPAAAVRSTT